MTAPNKTRIEPSDVIAMFADEKGCCRWVVVQLSTNRAGAFSSSQMKTAACTPQRNGAAELVVQLQLQGMTLCSDRATTQAGLDAAMKEAGIAEKDLLKIYGLAATADNPKVSAAPLHQYVVDQIVRSRSVSNQDRAGQNGMQSEDFAQAAPANAGDNDGAPRG